MIEAQWLDQHSTKAIHEQIIFLAQVSQTNWGIYWHKCKTTKIVVCFYFFQERMFTFCKQGMYHSCRLRIWFKYFLKKIKNNVINVGNRLKYSTFSNTHFWPVHTGSVCLDLAYIAQMPPLSFQATIPHKPRQVRWGELHTSVVTGWSPACLHM